MRTLIALACVAALSGCAIIIAPNDGDVRVHTLFKGDVVKGDGNLITEKRSVGTATALELKGSVQVDVRVGETASIEVEADSNLLPYVKTETSGDTLRVWVEGNVYSGNDIRVRYTVAQLGKIDSNGSGRLSVNGLNGAPLSVLNHGSRNIMLAGRTRNLDAQVHGSGGINASALETGTTNVALHGSGRVTLGQLKADSLTVSIRGSGGLQASGTAESVNARTHGSGDANLVGLVSQRADLASYGSGDISATVRQSLAASTNGSGRITVYGNPAQRSVSGKRVEVLN